MRLQEAAGFTNTDTSHEPISSPATWLTTITVDFWYRQSTSQRTAACLFSSLLFSLLANERMQTRFDCHRDNSIESFGNFGLQTTDWRSSHWHQPVTCACKRAVLYLWTSRTVAVASNWWHHGYDVRTTERNVTYVYVESWLTSVMRVVVSLWIAFIHQLR